MNTLELNNVSFSREWGTVLNAMSFTAQSHSLVKIVGNNGSGKTTLLKLLCLLLPLEQGVIRWNKQAIDEDRENYLETLIYIAHQNAISESLTPIENLKNRAYLRQRLPKQKYEDTLTECGLKNQLHTPCQELSAGQKRRVALASLRVFNADIWLLDEPFAALDKEGKELLCHWFKDHLESGGIIITSMHNESDLPMSATHFVQCSAKQPQNPQ